MAKKQVNKPASKHKGNPNWHKGMASPNPKGAPKRGQSWKETVDRIFNMTGPEAAAYGVQVASQLGRLPSTVTLKEAVMMRVAVALMNEPDARMLIGVMDRNEGKVKDEVEQHGEMVIRIERERSSDRPAESAPGAGEDQAGSAAI